MNEPLAFPRWRAFPPLALGTLMATVDISAVNIALPTLSRTFRQPITMVEWVVLAYVLTITGLLLAFGRIADRFGRRRTYGFGLALFTLSSALCAAAPGLGTLIAARALQGLGAAMVAANSSALLVSSFPPEERGRALGAFGAMVGVGLALGPALGGILVGYLSWRWIFLVNLPLGVVALRLLRTRIPADAGTPERAPLDLAGTLLWCGALTLLMLALTRGPQLGWRRPEIEWMLAGAAASFVAFLLVERVARAPLLPLPFLMGPVGRLGFLTLAGQAISIAVGIHLPLYLEAVGGFDAARSGRWLAVLPLSALLLAPLAGRWSDAKGPRLVATTGMALVAAGFFVLSGLGIVPSPLRLLAGMALVGVGLGLFTVPNASAMLAHAPAARLGLTSGFQATMRNLGFATGAAATAALAASRYAAHGGASDFGLEGVRREAFMLATRDVYLVIALFAALCVPWVASQTGLAKRVSAPVGELPQGPEPSQ